MQILIVDGWTAAGNQDHLGAGCVLQAQLFEGLVQDLLPKAKTTTINTHRPGSADQLDLSSFHAIIWTGGGGNIYESNDFNRDQLALCERVLTEVPYFWGSCWGLQVAATVLGGTVRKAQTAEIGIASDILVGSSDFAQQLYRGKAGKFDGPAHHGDEVSRLPSSFEILAENDVTVQAAVAESGKIVCVQYHPEIPYDYLRKLLIFWAPNYRAAFSEQQFQALLTKLAAKEQAEGGQRTVEFQNWLSLISTSGNVEPAG